MTSALAAFGSGIKGNPAAFQSTGQSTAASKAEELVKEALILAGIGDDKLARERLSEAMRLWGQMREPEKAARSSLLLGDSYRYLGRSKESLYYYNHALKVKPLSNQMRAASFNCIASLYAEIYQLDLAERFYIKAEDEARAARDVPARSEALSGLAVLYFRSGRHEQALARIKQARLLNRQQKNETEASLLHLTARIAQAQGLSANSLIALQEALAIYQQTGNGGEQVKVLCSISDFCLSSGQSQAALDRASEAHALAETLAKQAVSQGDKRRAWEWRWRASLALARAQSAMGQKKVATRSYNMAVSYLEAVWITVMLGTDAGAVAFGEERHVPYHELVDILIDQGNIDEAYFVSEQSRSRTIGILMAGRRTNGRPKSGEQDAALRELAASIANLRTQLLSRRISLKQREKIEKDIEENLFALEEAKAKTEMERFRGRTAWVTPASIEQVQKNLDKDKECVLEFFLGEERSFLWLISSDDLSVEILPGRKEIEKAVEQYLAVISARPNNLYLERQLATQREMAEKLFAMLFGRAARRLAPGKRLIVVPDGILYYLPFEALGRGGRYLVEDHEINYLPSASMLQLLEGSKNSAETGDKLELLAFGDPIFALKDSRAERGRNDAYDTERALRISDGFNLSPLPRTRDEVKEITGLFPPKLGRLFVGRASTEEAVKAESLQRYRRLHFATHSLVDERHPSRSAVVLTLDADPQEDGFLEMGEIAELDLDCDLVVLSACQTGRGRLLNGEGVIGLSRAFLYAGARSVVVSLWNVSDVSSSQFMKDFYQHLVKGSGNAAALREAKLQMIESRRETRHPYYWAPFIIVGKP